MGESGSGKSTLLASSSHTVSTILKAERIYVLQSGRIVQRGTFDELANIEGPFQDLVKRQIT